MPNGIMDEAICSPTTTLNNKNKQINIQNINIKMPINQRELKWRNLEN